MESNVDPANDIWLLTACQTIALHCNMTKTDQLIVCHFEMGWIAFKMTLETGYCTFISFLPDSVVGEW